MDTYADDLAALLEHLDVTGRRRWSASRPAAARSRATSAATAPARVAKVGARLGGAAVHAQDRRQPRRRADRGLRRHPRRLARRPRAAYRDLADGPFFGNNREGANVSQGIRDAFWRRACRPARRNAYESIAAFSATDFRPDLAKFDVPTLVIHGDDDQVVPYEVGGKASAALIDGAKLITYEGAPHGITDTHKERLGNDLLEFLRSEPVGAS